MELSVRVGKFRGKQIAILRVSSLGDIRTQAREPTLARILAQVAGTTGGGNAIIVTSLPVPTRKALEVVLLALKPVLMKHFQRIWLGIGNRIETEEGDDQGLTEEIDDPEA